MKLLLALLFFTTLLFSANESFSKSKKQLSIVGVNITIKIRRI